MTFKTHNQRVAEHGKLSRVASISNRLLAANGVDPSASPRTAEALAILDPERVGSIAGVMRLLAQSADAIEGDASLSAIGKRDRIAAESSSRLGNIASIAETVTRLEAEHHHDAAEAVQIPEASAADVLIDLAIAAHVREINPIPSKLEAMSKRVRLAVVRTPWELTGISAEVQARVRGSLVDAATAARLGAEAEALAAARRAVQGAIDVVAPDAGWNPRELARHFGVAWRLPGVAETMAARLAQEAADTGA